MDNLPSYDSMECPVVVSKVRRNSTVNGLSNFLQNTNICQSINQTHESESDLELFEPPSEFFSV